MFAASSLWVAGLLGCDGGTAAERFRQLEQENLQLRDKVEKLNEDLASKKALIDAQRQQLANLRRLGKDRLDKLYHVAKIEIERLSGGADYDGKPGDDGVTVYLQPLDQDGHVIKAAGNIRIQLFDLANPDGKHLIGEYRLDVDHARKAWHGRFMTNHYTVKCPWRKSPPTHREITIRAEFTDYLTGRTFRAQRVVEIALP